MILKKTLYTAIVLLCITGISSTVISCPTCLAHLKRSDQPFFMRQISAQIATQATIKSMTQKKASAPIQLKSKQ